MKNIIHTFVERGLLNAPPHLADSVKYLVRMGSSAFGVDGLQSDADVYGFYIPPKAVLFPHLRGEITGFGKPPEVVDHFEQQHVWADTDDGGRQEYDFKLRTIVRFFDLLANGNANVVEQLFVEPENVLQTSSIATLVLLKRHIFLTKKTVRAFIGFAEDQLKEIRNKDFPSKCNPGGQAQKSSAKTSKPSKRLASIETYGYDIKAGYHIVRLLHQAEQIVMFRDLKLKANREVLMPIRDGKWTLEQIKKCQVEMTRHINDTLKRSSLPERCDEQAVRNLLIDCLQMHFGNIDDCFDVKQARNFVQAR